MKKVLLVLFLIFLVLSSLYSDTVGSPKQFEMFFTKRGETSVGIYDSAGNNPVDHIDFSLWQTTTGDNPDMPTAKFTIKWDLFHGTNYSVTLTFNSDSDKSGIRMLKSDSASLNFSAKVTKRTVGTTTEESGLDAFTAQNEVNANAYSLSVISGNRNTNTMVTGEANIELTLVPNTSQSDAYFMAGDYSGYVFLSLVAND